MTLQPRAYQLRIALLAGMLALMSNLAVIGFIYWRNHESGSTARRQVIEQAHVLSDVYRSAGVALDDAIDDTVDLSDPQTAAALFDPARPPVMGNHQPTSLRATRARGYREDSSAARPATPARSVIVRTGCRHGGWLVNGRHLRRGSCPARHARTLAAHRAGVRRFARTDVRGDPRPICRPADRGIAAVADRISGRDLSQRIPLTSGTTRSIVWAARSMQCSTGSAR